MIWNPKDTVNDGLYTIERKLGDGRFSSTFLAYHNRGTYNNERLVIKTWREVTDKDTAQSADQIKELNEKLHKEATKLSKCDSPYIVSLIDEEFSETDSYGNEWVCLPLEYIPGIKLHELSQQMLSEADALRYIRQIGRGLMEVHDKKLVHLDVKPDNIIIRQQTNEAVLIGFDFSRNPTKGLTPKTMNKAVDGFAAPEWYQTGAVDVRTDIYSLAATLYFLVTGQVPFNADKRLSGQNLPFPKTSKPTISERMKDAINWGMEIDVENRPENMQDWLKKLGRSYFDWDWFADRHGVKWTAASALAALAGVVVTLAIGLGWISPPSPAERTDPANNEVILTQ